MDENTGKDGQNDEKAGEAAPAKDSKDGQGGAELPKRKATAMDDPEKAIEEKEEKKAKKDAGEKEEKRARKQTEKNDEKRRRKDEEGRPEKNEKAPKKGSSGILGLVRDIAVSAAIVTIILASLYGYTGVWPPMVVIESSSMMHGSDSQVGVIDTGDLTLVKAIHDRHDVVTFVEAKNPKDPHNGFQTYGEYGNVIVYRKNGLTETPVIHRAIAWIVFNTTASDIQNRIFRGDIPDAGAYNVDSYTVQDVLCAGNKHLPVPIYLGAIFSSSVTPHSGFVTHGDNNPPYVDQQVLQTATGGKVENIKVDWVVGKAEGELPWFGLFKLWISGHDSSKFPPSSVQGLVITIVLLVAVPIVVDYSLSWRKKRNENRKDIREKTRKTKFR
jgi:signal peptidase